MSSELYYCLVRVLCPIVLAVLFFFHNWRYHKEEVSGRPRTYVAFASLSFFYGMLNIIADLCEKWPAIRTQLTEANAPDKLNRFIHSEADNIVLSTVGIALFFAVDAIVTTRIDIEKSQNEVLSAIARLTKIGNVQPLVRRCRSNWFWW